MRKSFRSLVERFGVLRSFVTSTWTFRLRSMKLDDDFRIKSCRACGQSVVPCMYQPWLTEKHDGYGWFRSVALVGL